MYNEHLNWCLTLYTILGVSVKKNGIIQKLHYAFNVICPLTISYLTIYMMYLNRPFNIEYLGEVSTALTTFPHAVIKLTTIFIRKSEIDDLFERSKLYFWKTDDDDDDDDTLEIKRVLKKGSTLKTVYYYSVVFFIFTTILKTILSNDLAYKCYEPNWIPKLVLIIFQDYTCCIVLLTLIGFDVMVQTLLILIKVQFMMLNKRLRDMFTHKNTQDIKSKEMYRRLKDCVEHQVFLIDFINRFKAAFSLTFLLFIGNIIISLCMSVYIILSDTSKLNLKIEAVVHTIAGLNEICLCYSIPAQLFMDEAAKVMNSVYFSNWYEHPKYAKAILPILTREQKSLKIAAGGFVVIDLQMFMAACKTIVSYSMFLNTMTQLQLQQ